MRQFLFVTLAVLTGLSFAWSSPAEAQSSGYRVQPGDVLGINVLEDETLNSQSLVLPDGRISVPLAGSIRAAGNTVETIESTIADRLSSNFAVRPSVFVSVIEVDDTNDTFPIYVLGEVNAPGLQEVEAGTTLLQAIALAGGPDRFAATKRIQLRRMDAASKTERLYIFNYHAVERGAAIQNMITLREGDVIVVPERRLFE